MNYIVIRFIILLHININYIFKYEQVRIETD